MEWWSIGFLAGALFVMIFGGVIGYLEEMNEETDNRDAVPDDEPDGNSRSVARSPERHSQEEVKLVLYECRRYACRYEREVLTQLIDDMEREDTDELQDNQ
jgi:hypothetical protein